MAISKFRMKRIVARDTIPQVADMSREVLHARPFVAVMKDFSVETHRHFAYYNDRFPSNQYYKHWYVKLSVNVVMETANGRTVSVALPLVVRHTPRGVPDFIKALTDFQKIVEEKARIGFDTFDFSLSIHADQIPAGITVDVEPLTIASEAVAITISTTSGQVLLSRSFPLGRKVLHDGCVKVYVAGEPLWINTAIAHYVKVAIREVQTGESAAALKTPAALHFPRAQVDEFEKASARMVQDFARHADLARAARR